VSAVADSPAGSYTVTVLRRQVRIGCHWIGCPWCVDVETPTSLDEIHDAVRDHYEQTGHG
jgi:dipeptidase